MHTDGDNITAFFTELLRVVDREWIKITRETAEFVLEND
jgi:hypothetical protein